MSSNVEGVPIAKTQLYNIIVPCISLAFRTNFYLQYSTAVPYYITNTKKNAILHFSVLLQFLQIWLTHLNITPNNSQLSVTTNNSTPKQKYIFQPDFCVRYSVSLECESERCYQTARVNDWRNKVRARVIHARAIVSRTLAYFSSLATCFHLKNIIFCIKVSADHSLLFSVSL